MSKESQELLKEMIEIVDGALYFEQYEWAKEVIDKYKVEIEEKKKYENISKEIHEFIISKGSLEFFQDMKEMLNKCGNDKKQKVEIIKKLIPVNTMEEINNILRAFEYAKINYK